MNTPQSQPLSCFGMSFGADTVHSDESHVSLSLFCASSQA